MIDDEAKVRAWRALVQELAPDINPRSIRLVEEMRRVSRSLHHVGESSLSDSGLSFAKYRLLMTLFFNEQIESRACLNPSEISERQGTSRNTISSLIRDLEADGLIERRLDLQDRRRFNICLTSNGRGLVQEHLQRHYRMIGESFDMLTVDEQITLSNLLTKVYSQITEVKAVQTPQT